MPAPLVKGVLIVFEGIDGTGKSTQLELLADSLIERGLPVITTREPTDGPTGRKIRELYISRNSVTRQEELELFLLDRKEHVETLLLPALSDGKIILCDRYYLSTVAYQGAAGHDPATLLELNSFAPKPDLALIFQATPKTTTERITQKRGNSLNDFEQIESLQKVATIFDTLELPYIRRIDASGSIDNIQSLVLSEVDDVLIQYQYVDPE